MDGSFEPDEFAKRISLVMIGGGVLCMLFGWLWWGIAAALNARAPRASGRCRRWYVPLTYFAVGGAAVLAGMSPRWLDDQAIYARACALAFGVVMFFSTLGTYRTHRGGGGLGDEVLHAPHRRAVGGVRCRRRVWWFWHYLPTQAILGAYVGAAVGAGPVRAVDVSGDARRSTRPCAGTRQMRQDDQEFAKFFKPAG